MNNWKHVGDIKMTKQDQDLVTAAEDQGICPNCGKKVVRGQAVKIDGDYIGHPFNCSCGFVGTKWYKR